MTEKDEKYDPEKFYEYCIQGDWDIEHGDALVFPSDKHPCVSGTRCQFHAILRGREAVRRREIRDKRRRRLPDATSFVAEFCRDLNKEWLASKSLSQGLRGDVQATLYEVAERSLGLDLPHCAPLARVEVPRKTWVLSSSRSWDYGSKLGRSCQEIGQIL